MPAHTHSACLAWPHWSLPPFFLYAWQCKGIHLLLVFPVLRCVFESPGQWRDTEVFLTLHFKQHWLSLLSVYQHNAAHWDERQHPLLQGVGLSFHSLCGALCCRGRWHPAVGLALIIHGGESVAALCRLLWSAASVQSPGSNVLFMGNNQDLTSERVLKWYL